MDASRYFEEMHRAMSAQKTNSSLLLTVKVQDLGGADAYLELRQSPNGRARVFYSTMGRRNLNFQLFRKGWQLCHNASGEMTGQFPTRAENLLDSADFSACIRDDTLDAGRTEIILRELRRAAGTSRSCLPQSAREGAMITVESFVGRGGEWNYWSTRAADCLPLRQSSAGWAIFWPERSVVPCNPALKPWHWPPDGRPNSSPPLHNPADCVQRPARTVSPSAPRRAAQQVQNPRWQSILAVLATV